VVHDSGERGWARPPAVDWLTRQLGARLVARPGQLPEQVGLALRFNPRRAHLLVFAALGKYVPTHPGSVCQAGTTLGRQVARCLGDAQSLRDTPLVVGYAETATALGHLVADVLEAPYLHSTRRAVPGGRVSAAFTEPHSHAPGHLLLPARPDMLGGGGPLVLVDDELSTGTTAANTIEAVHARYPRRHYVLACLMDVRSVADRDSMTARVAALGARVEVVALARGVVELPTDMAFRSAQVVAAHTRRTPPPPPPPARTRLSQLHPAWPAGLPEGGRHGFTPAHRRALDAVVADIAASLATMVQWAASRFPDSCLVGYFMLRAVGSGARCRPHGGSCSRVPSGDVGCCSGIRCTGQRLRGRVRGSGRRCG
jgi:hypothetical protein